MAEEQRAALANLGNKFRVSQQDPKIAQETAAKLAQEKVAKEKLAKETANKIAQEKEKEKLKFFSKIKFRSDVQIPHTKKR
jgi:hypothetical protein